MARIAEESSKESAQSEEQISYLTWVQERKKIKGAATKCVTEPAACNACVCVCVGVCEGVYWPEDDPAERMISRIK